MARPFHWFTAAGALHGDTPHRINLRHHHVSSLESSTGVPESLGNKLGVSTGVGKIVSDALALAAESLRDAESMLDDDDASYADIAEAALSSYQLEGEVGGSCAVSKATAMAYSMLLDSSFVVQLIVQLNSGVQIGKGLNQKLQAMRYEATLRPSTSFEGSIKPGVVLAGVSRVAGGIRQIGSCFAPDTNCSLILGIHDPANEELFRQAFAMQSASPPTDAKMIALISTLIALGSLKVFRWSVLDLLAHLVEASNPISILRSLFNIFVTSMLLAIVGYSMYSAHHQPSRWYKHREKFIMAFRLFNRLFAITMVYAPAALNRMVFSATLGRELGVLVGSVATGVYRLRIDRHIFMEVLDVPSTVILPGIMCGLSAADMLYMFVTRTILSVVFSLYLWHCEKKLRRRFAQKFADKLE